MLRNQAVYDTVKQKDDHPIHTFVFLDDGQTLDISLSTTIIEIKVLRPDSVASFALPGSQVGKTGNKGEVFWKFTKDNVSVQGTYTIQVRAFFAGEQYTAIDNLRLRVKREL